MSSPPKVFVSAASGDLRSIRELVKNALLTIGCHPVEQTNFPPDYRTVQDMLRGRIQECHALIHIVGLRYGAEPNPSALPPETPRRSYTQMEYDIGRELQKSRGNKRFRIYTFVCPQDFPYGPEPDSEDPEKRELQQSHRQAILQGEVLFETPGDRSALQARIHALREETLSLLTAQQRRMRGITAAVLASVILIGLGLYTWLPQLVTTSVSESLSPEAVATRFRTDIEADFQRTREELVQQRQDWQAIRELERRRDMRLAQVDNLMAVIRAGLSNNPGPIFTEAVRISEQEGVDAALAYMDSHQSDMMANVDNAAAQAAMANEKLQQALQPVLLKAELHSTQLQWDAALALLRQAVQKAPQWYEVHLRLGNLLYTLARYPEAEEEFKTALALAQSDTEQAVVMNNLALLLRDTNRLAEAEPLMKRALAIDEASYGKDHPKVAIRLSNLALLLRDTNRLAEAEPLMKRALAIDEASYGKDHPNVARDLNSLGSLFQATNRLAEAEPLMRRAAGIVETSYGKDHPIVATLLNNLAQMLQSTNRLAEAEPLIKRALTINETSYGPEHPYVAINLNNLAQLLHDTNRLVEAEPLMRRTLIILLKFTRNTGHDHSNLKYAFTNYQDLLATMKLNAKDTTARLNQLGKDAGYSPADWQVLQARLNKKAPR